MATERSYAARKLSRTFGLIGQGISAAGPLVGLLEKRQAQTQFSNAKVQARAATFDFFSELDKNTDPTTYFEAFEKFTATTYDQIAQTLTNANAKHNFEMMWGESKQTSYERVAVLANENSIMYGEQTMISNLETTLAMGPVKGTSHKEHLVNQRQRIAEEIRGYLENGVINADQAAAYLRKYGTTLDRNTAVDLSREATGMLRGMGYSPEWIEGFLTEAIRREGAEFDAWLAESGIDADPRLLDIASTYRGINLAPEVEDQVVEDMMREIARESNRADKIWEDMERQAEAEISDRWTSPDWETLGNNDFAAVRGMPTEDKWINRYERRIETEKTQPMTTNEQDEAARGYENRRAELDKTGDTFIADLDLLIKEVGADEKMVSGVRRAEVAKLQTLRAERLRTDFAVEKAVLKKEQDDRAAAVLAANEENLLGIGIRAEELRRLGNTSEARTLLEQQKQKLVTDDTLGDSQRTQKKNEIQRMIDEIDKLDAWAAKEDDTRQAKEDELQADIDYASKKQAYDEKIMELALDVNLNQGDVEEIERLMREVADVFTDEQDRNERLKDLRGLHAKALRRPAGSNPEVESRIMQMIFSTGSDKGILTEIDDALARRDLTREDATQLKSYLGAKRADIRQNISFSTVWAANKTMFNSHMNSQLSAQDRVNTSLAKVNAERALLRLLNKPGFRDQSEANQIKDLAQLQREIAAPLAAEGFLRSIFGRDIYSGADYGQLIREEWSDISIGLFEEKLEAQWLEQYSDFREDYGIDLGEGEFSTLWGEPLLRFGDAVLTRSPRINTQEWGVVGRVLDFVGLELVTGDIWWYALDEDIDRNSETIDWHPVPRKKRDSPLWGLRK